MANKFEIYSGDLMGLPTNENHLNYIWNDPDCKVLFSATKQGKAMSCHVACDKRGVFRIVKAINEFIDFIFQNYQWCDMLISKNNNKKLEPILERCGCKVAKRLDENKALYVRERSWDL